MLLKTNRYRCFSLIVLLFYSVLISGQNKINNTIENSYEKLYELYTKTKDFEKKKRYAKLYLKKAKKGDNNLYLVRAYRIFSLLYKDEKSLCYSDSIISLTKQIDNEHYPALAYKSKGDYYYTNNDFKKALNNYLLFSKYANKHNQENYISSSNYYIGIIKRRVGDLDEALEIYQKNFAYTQANEYSINNDITYLNSITSLANIFNDMKSVDSATYYNKYGMHESKRLNNDFYYAHFSLNQGVTHYFKKDFKIAIDSLEKHIPYFKENNNLQELSVAYFYCGESYLEINSPEKAINYFKKVDTIFQKTESLFPILRKTYIRLTDYYREEKDSENLLKYINQSIKNDSILSSDLSYLNTKISKEYDIPKLKNEKKEILIAMKTQKRTYKNILVLLYSLITLLIIGYAIQYRKRKRYKKRFNSIINTKRNIQKPKKDTSSEIKLKKVSVPENIVESILIALEAFEENNEFVSNQITLHYLSKKMNTNPNYLSKVINHYKKCSFSNYINTLRIEYIIEQLKTNHIYRKYTLKAISMEAGFNNVQSFAKAFYNSKGINPSYFIKELKKKL